MSIDIANTPHSWGVYSAESAPLPYGEVLDAMRDAGYAGTTLGPWGYYPTEAEALRAELNQRDLALVSAVLYANLTDPAAHAQAQAHLLEVGGLLAALGADLLTLADRVEPDSRLAKQAGRVRAPRLGPERWDDLADHVNLLARSLNEETGLRMAFRHYVGTHVEIDEEVALLMERLDPALVGLCLDTGHWRYAGGDVLEAIETYGDRIWQVYLSDSEPTIRQFSLDEQLTFYEATQAGVLSLLGSGDIDIEAVMQGLEDQNYAGWVVLEQDSLSDEPADQLLNARSNREYLRDMGF